MGKVLPSARFVIVLTCRRSNEAFQTDAFPAIAASELRLNAGSVSPL
jgi:hypothetical protein